MARFVQFILIILSFVALYTKYYLSFQNGFIGLLSTTRSQGSLSRLHNSLRSHYTGWGPLDEFLKACNVFFWPIFYGTSPALSLYAIAFAGSMVPMWLILFIHTCGKSSIVEIIVINALAGLLVQGLGPGLVVCVLLAMRNTSTKGFAVTGMPAVSMLGPNTLPLSLIVCYILPLVLGSLPAPTWFSVSSKQFFIAIWQGWSLYVALAIGITHSLTHRSSRSRPHELFRQAYIFALACSVITHIGILSISLLSLSSMSQFFSLQSVDLHPRNLFLPRPPWSEAEITSVESGVLRFLHWDYGISSTGTLLWCYSVYWEDRIRGNGSVHFLSLWSRLFAMSLAFGPCSVALALYWGALSMNLMEQEHVRER